MAQVNHIILFDGVCNFCNASVNFCIRHDNKNKFQYAALQSAIGMKLKEQYGILPDADSVILIEDNKAYTCSTAALRICRHLSFPSKLLAVFLVVPAFVRDPVYNWVARNRYKWFGKKETCMIPNARIREKFLS